ncbi:MAG: DUF445 family protein [Acidimicrobiia bacterium]|nr:DUF445 family protein [Acidimicrobiia bacterium]
MGTGLVFVVIPLVAAAIGLITKWVAIKLIFHPARWVGIGPIGWQGIVQRRAPKFAAGIADTVLTAGLGVDSILDRVDPEELVDILTPTIDAQAPDVVPALVDAVRPGLWDELAPQARGTVIDHIRVEGKRVAVSLVAELKPVLADAVDLKSTIVAELSGENANRLARLVRRLAGRDLNVVIAYGGVLGFLMGLVAAAGYTFLERWWLMPFVGVIDGVVNNWLAIQMIFRPRERTWYLGVFPYQGLFHRRKEEIAAEYSAMLAEEVLTPESLFAHLAGSTDAFQLYQVGLQALERELEAQIDQVAALLGEPVDPGARSRVLAVLMQRIPAALPQALPEIQGYLAKRLEIAETMERALVAMPPEEFEQVLRGIFTEDETTIVAIGGALGGLIGLGQAAIVLAMTAA